MLRKLMRAAADMGVEVHMSHMDDPDVLGCYDNNNRRIYISFGLTPDEVCSTLAHELGHAFYGDDGSTPANERRAQRYAAQLLIDPNDYARAERENSDVWAIAEALGVTVELVEVYQQQCLQRLGYRTYGRSWRVGITPAAARQLSS